MTPSDQRREFLAALRVGDEVIVRRVARVRGRSVERLERVEKVWPEDGVCRFRVGGTLFDRDGRAGGTWGSRAVIEPATPAKRERFTRERLIAELLTAPLEELATADLAALARTLEQMRQRSRRDAEAA